MKLSSKLGTLALSSLIAVAPLAAFAQTAAVGVGVTATPVSANVTVKAAAKISATISKTIARADQEITRRINNLNTASARLNDMKNISASEKASLQAGISTEVGNLTGLKATIDADTDATKLKTDVQSITLDYRVYMLVLPQGRIAAAADRVATIVSQMQQLSTKLSARITAAQAAGKNVTAAQAAYTDMQAKIADASTQSQAALTETQNLAPDQGNTTVEASNTAAIKDALAKLKTVQSDLKAARVDIKTIMDAVKGTGVSGSATTTIKAQ
jgi:hypothetical protein